MSRRIITRRLGDYTDAIFPPVTDIAALREQAVNDITDKTVVYVDDEGLYVYSSSSVLADDGIAVLAPTVGAGRWLCVTRTGAGILGSDWWPSVISATNVVPGAPADGDRYLVTAVAPGLWTGQEEKAAEWNSSSSEWVFYTPTAGTVVYVAATTDYVAYNNAHPAGAWVSVESVLSHTLLADLTTGDPHTQYQQESEKGAALGYASLDGAGQVPVAQLPASVVGGLKYQGTWNANTNTPDVTAAPAQGYYYVVSVAGVTNLSGITDWQVNDIASYNGTTWDKIDSTDQVLSVNGLTGAVTGLEVTSAKGAASGYASLDASSRVEQSVKVVRATAPGTGAGAIGVSGGNLLFGTGAVEEQAERVTRKGVVNGYASLDGAGQVVEPPAGGKVLTGLSAGGAFRRIGNGTTNIAGAATVTLGTFTRNANEQLFPTMWVQQDVATLGFGFDRAAIGTEGISLFFDRTLNANEFRVRAINNNVTTARDVEWAVYGIIP